eukprot:GHVQ01022347.1.p1 GENE.GHVQ01022347.1~~GHVQ01022347.1.p1  ORF type:complete len:179 (+),score=21.90 GHVQ01022347.1:397-933(+)
MTLINKTVKEWLLVVVLALLWSVLCLSPFMAAAADETSPQNTDSVADGHPAVSVSRAERSKYCLGRSLFLLGVFAFGSFIAFIASKYLVGSLDTAIIESPFTDSVYRVTDKLGIFAIVALTTSLILGGIGILVRVHSSISKRLCKTKPTDKPNRHEQDAEHSGNIEEASRILTQHTPC